MFREIRVSPKMKIPPETLFHTLNLENFATDAKCDINNDSSQSGSNIDCAIQWYTK